jgi:threonine dehydratase
MESQLIEAVSYHDVLAAGERLQGHAVRTPLLENQLVNKLAGRRILVKAECLQVTGAFKFRGAWSALTGLDEQARAQGVIAYSSGNHAQAVAYAANRLKVPAVIIMPSDAPALKLANTRAYGAEVVLYDRQGGESREQLGEELAAKRNLSLIRPYDHPLVIAGQGTCGLEIADQARSCGVSEADVLVCCGGGGLTSGIALALEGRESRLKVKPVEPQAGDDVCRSLVSGQREHNESTPLSICDAIVTPSPGKLTFPILKRLCEYGIAVSDEQALQAIAVAMLRYKIVAEPGGAVALAAALYKPEALQQDTVICVVSGGNVDPGVFAKAMTTDHGH